MDPPEREAEQVRSVVLPEGYVAERRDAPSRSYFVYRAPDGTPMLFDIESVKRLRARALSTREGEQQNEKKEAELHILQRLLVQRLKC